MEKDSQINIKSLVAVSIIGYICILIVSYIERILSSIFKIIGYLTNVKASILFFSDIIPQLIIITFWIILIFKYLNNFSGKINLKSDLNRKYAIRIGISALILFLCSIGFSRLEMLVMETFYTDSLNWTFQEQAINYLILSSIHFIKIIIVVIGFLRIVTKSTSEN